MARTMEPTARDEVSFWRGLKPVFGSPGVVAVLDVPDVVPLPLEAEQTGPLMVL